ncbi:MAG TPA: proton-conducting transporter membrane subunit, partial [Cyclobacteriaceae bacterium]|nr:proton-conducting transporter membrane subunit [Cyclobacteriaceae bacterium]
RLLAYSSVGHVGYILLGFLADPVSSSSVVFYYLIAYAASSLGAFAIFRMIEREQGNLSIDSFNGLFKRNPFIAVAMTLALLSLAGIPPLPGFFGKYLVFALAVDHGFVGLVCVAVVTSLIGAYYYFKIIITMFMKEPVGSPAKPSTSENVLTALLLTLTIIIGIFPNWLISLIGS